MSLATAAAVPATPALAHAKIWALHLLCFTLPLLTLGFVVTGPHPWYVALASFAVVPIFAAIDNRSGPAEHLPAADLPALPFDVVLVTLVALQLVNVGLAARMAAHAGLFSLDALATTVLVGATSAYSAIVVAHELIHRKSKAMALLGRVLLWTVMYDHFFTEHVRGHHARVGTEDDPATSRFGETYGEFWRRTVPGQLRSAFRIEAKRLGDEDMSWLDRRSLRNTVVHGIALQTAVAVAIFALLGPAAGVVYLLQAYVAVRLLEAVNYFEHYGLRRVGKKVRPVDSWDSDSWFTLFALVGLSRHADHHAYAARPYQSLRPWAESPKLPHGYVGMVVLVLFRNAEARRLLEIELRRTRLGPFAEAV
ncbi:MAG: alkane 1-monooxygenase [Byssovorax sp.]